MKKFLVLLIAILTLAAFSSAATVVNLDPIGLVTNNTMKDSATIYYNYNVSGNSSTWLCKLYTNDGGSFTEVQTMSSVANNTNTNFTYRSVSDTVGVTYIWNVFCNSTIDSTGAWGALGNYTFGVDTVDPTVEINSPTDASWDTNGYVTWNITVTDRNADECILKGTMNSTSNTTGSYETQEIKDYANVTWVNFTFGQDTNKWADKSNNMYSWSVTCNDTAGNTVVYGNYTFNVDTTVPSDFDMNTSNFKTSNGVQLLNNSLSTDYTPQVNWNLTVEANFSRYRVLFCNDTIMGDSCVEKNVTTITELLTNITTLEADETYYIGIQAYDVAGNYKNMSTKTYTYRTDSTNRYLRSGWNIVGNTGNALTLGQILNYTGGTTASYWNSSHEFISHVSGGSYATISVPAGESFLVYLSADINFSDLVVNTSAFDKEYQGINGTNTTSSGWSIVMMRDSANDHKLGNIDLYMNCADHLSICLPSQNNITNISYMSLYNNSAAAGAKYVPFVANWSISNETVVRFGDSIWMYMETSILPYIIINWTAIS